MIKQYVGNSQINTMRARVNFSLESKRKSERVHSQCEMEEIFDPKISPFPLAQSKKVHRRALALISSFLYSLSLLWKSATLIIWSPNVKTSTREPMTCTWISQIYRMAQFGLKMEKSSNIIFAHGSQNLRSPSPIMAPEPSQFTSP